MRKTGNTNRSRDKKMASASGAGRRRSGSGREDARYSEDRRSTKKSFGKDKKSFGKDLEGQKPFGRNAGKKDDFRAPTKVSEDRPVKMVEPLNEEMDREDRVEGKNAVFEALRSSRPANKLYVEKDSQDAFLLRIIAMAREKDIPIQYVERKKLDTMSLTRAHQGVILETAAREYVEVDDILAVAKEKGEDPFILVLDEITDTNNFGSIIRSAECAGVHGIIIPKRRSVSLNATVAKVAAGALEYVPVARVTNLVQTLRSLKNEGIWIIGTDMDGESVYYETDLKGPCALVIGSEGEGMSRLVKNECDLVVKIPMKGTISSLNAGVAAALVMFEIAKQRSK